jgi:hypothetical protein
MALRIFSTWLLYTQMAINAIYVINQTLQGKLHHTGIHSTILDYERRLS